MLEFAHVNLLENVLIRWHDLLAVGYFYTAVDDTLKRCEHLRTFGGAVQTDVQDGLFDLAAPGPLGRQ